VIAIAGGFVAAAMWALSTLSTSRSSRMIPPSSVLAWVMVTGTIVVLPIGIAAGPPRDLDAATTGWLVVVGAANVVGLLLVYSALRVGKVGIVAPIASAEGAVAALLAVLAGERIAAGAGAMLVLIAIGVVMASVSRDDDPTARRHNGTAVLLAGASAVLFGFGLYAAARLSGEIPLAWIILPSRLLGVVALALPLALTRRLRITRDSAPFVVTSGLAEIVGLATFTVGSRHGIAVAAVIASQFAALAAVGAFFLFRERLARVQVVGVVAIAIGVAVLTGLQV
jgi:drug/metabolite transporter (DMT)-like permease